MSDLDKEVPAGSSGGGSSSSESKGRFLFNLPDTSDTPGKRGKVTPAQSAQTSKNTSSSTGGFTFDVGALGQRDRIDYDDIWERAFSLINSQEIDAIYDSKPEARKLHTSDEAGQFTTCCPNCCDVHFRKDCLYDVTDLILYYIRTENSSKRIFDTLMTLGIGGIDFTRKKLFDAKIGNGRFRLYYSCEDAVIAMCETVMRMDVVSNAPSKPESGDDLKALFEKACKRRIFVHFPSIYFLTNPDIFSDLASRNQDYYSDSDDRDEDGGNTTKSEKIIDLDNIKVVLELLLEVPEKIICDLSIDSDMRVYDERNEGNAKPNMIILRCKNCGMPVALTAGEHDEFIIGMAGLTSAGKSSVIYAINYLVTEKCRDICFPYSQEHGNSFTLSFSYNPYDSGSGPLREDREKFAKGRSITKTSRGERFHSTITVSLEKNGVVEKTINLVLIDIAGETAYGNDTQAIYFLADCFWFCILPSQNGIPDGMVRNDNEDPTRRYDFYKDVFARRNEGKGNNKVPLAVIYTRSDCYPTDRDIICRPADDHSTDMDLIKNFIISDGVTAGVNARAIRQNSMDILDYMARIREGRDVGRYSLFSDISLVRPEMESSEAPGRCPVNGMTFFEPLSRYCVFSCSPYGRKPLDAEKSMWEKEREEAVKKLKEARSRLDSLKAVFLDHKAAVEKEEEAVEAAKRDLESARDEASSDAARKHLEDSERALEIAKATFLSHENDYNAAQQAYDSARKDEINAQIEWNKAVAAYDFSGQDTPPNPFGVMLPVLWSLSQEGSLLSVMVNRGGETINVDDDWLALNRYGELPLQDEDDGSVFRRFFKQVKLSFKK